jgi:hypothetical protein
MNFQQAQTLINEARNLHYHFTEWETKFVHDLQLRRPDVLTPKQAQSVVWIYEKAAGGGKFEKRTIVAGRHRYNPEL